MIDAVGEDVADVAPGDRVAMLSRIGASPAYDVARADAVVKLPPELAGQPFPGEPLGCAMNIFRRSDIHAGQTRRDRRHRLPRRDPDAAGDRRRRARDRHLAPAVVARPRAPSFGAAETIAMDDHYAIIEKVKAPHRRALCERVIEAVGKQWPLDLAVRDSSASAGKLVVAGYHQDGPRQVNMQMWNWKGIDVIERARARSGGVPGWTARGGRGGGERADRSRRGSTRTSIRSISLGDALDATRDKPDGFVKALIRYDV